MICGCLKWSCALVLGLLLVLPAVGSAAASPADALGEAPLGEFIPTSPPLPAPAVAFADAAGNLVHLSDFGGKPVLVNLWATWCAPCRREMPSLDRLQAKLGAKLTVLAISEDRGGSETVQPFIAKLGLKSVKFYLDPKSAVGRAFKVQGLPTSILIDAQGKVLGRVEGAAEWDSPKILGVIEPLLTEDGLVKTSAPQAHP